MPASPAHWLFAVCKIGHFVLLYTVISNSRGHYTILKNLGLSLYNLYGVLHALSTPEKALISGHDQEVVH